MAKYLLDTNIISYLADAKSRFHDPVMKAFESLTNEDAVSLSILSLYEIEYGFAHGDASQFAEKVRRTKEELLTVMIFFP